MDCVTIEIFEIYDRITMGLLQFCSIDSIEGVSLVVQVDRKSMRDELEEMLDVVDPQPIGKLGSMKWRKFDLPDGGIQKEIAAGVAEFVRCSIKLTMEAVLLKLDCGSLW
uniref:Uncharacterized protein n=1 Tax=Nelumbo nucifera TaxID=4432 RepID=A0A822YX11_NELNU|nr:TPA_asm: hypothetical protein HUJ06_006711 [Nelumbo nucifera]